MKNRLVITLVFILSLSGFSLFGKPEIRTIDEVLNRTKVFLTENNWKLIKKSFKNQQGEIKLFQRNWLMYFLHWRPLTEKNRKLSIPYAKKMLLNFWGPSMPFKLKGNGGTTTIAGHNAYYIDGTIYNNKIRTRFFIWNCPETGRQFISDCNINLSLGTPAKWIDTQFDITRTIACHEGAAVNSFTHLPKRSHLPAYKLSFQIPENWVTNEYKNQKWFPNGLNDKNGSLWTLLSDSQKLVYYRWTKEQKTLDKSLLLNYLKRSDKLPNTYMKNGTTYITGIKPGEIRREGSKLICDLRFRIEGKMGKYPIKEKFTAKAFLWKAGGLTHFLIAGIVLRDKVWGMDNDITPSKKLFSHWINTHVLPGIKHFSR